MLSASKPDVHPAPLEQPELFEPEHTSLQEARLQFGLAERVYAERWKLLNKRSPGLNSGYTYLEHILTPSGKRNPSPVSARDARVAASVIQWLGTNCGGAFLRATERIIEDKQMEADEIERAEHELLMLEWTTGKKRDVFPLTFYRVSPAKTRLIDLE